MEDTGRIKRALRPALRRMLFGENADADIEAEMREACAVDRAHVLMLARQGLIARETARALVSQIELLEAADFEPLRGKHAPRGLYMLYEDHLIAALGADVGGWLQLGRSRNDRGATILRMRLRRRAALLGCELGRLIAELERRAAEHAAVVMPIHTHYQPAFPITYGHYLAGLGLALERDLAQLVGAMGELARSPLGAGAVGGTSVPIDPALTAELLGFEDPPLNSVDAVASRDHVLRLLAAAAILGTTVSRCAQDLLLWSSQEYGFLELPDELVGSSSMMPQKRNVYLLEHVQGRSAAALGAFTAAAAAMRGAPFTNSIAVGTEGVGHVWSALERTREALVILRRIVAEARAVPGRMLERAREGFTQATALAERAVLERGLPFRTAHKEVGELVARALAGESAPGEELLLDPAAVVPTLRHGAGPALENVHGALRALRERRRAQLARLRLWTRRWRGARAKLELLARELD